MSQVAPKSLLDRIRAAAGGHAAAPELAPTDRRPCIHRGETTGYCTTCKGRVAEFICAKSGLAVKESKCSACWDDYEAEPMVFDGKIAVVINAADEGGRLRSTIETFRENLAGNKFFFTVVADGVTDGCCDNLGDDVAVLRNDKRVGCGKAKCQATTALEELLGDDDVALFYDAHCAPIRGWLAEQAVAAKETGGIVCPALVNMTYDDQWVPTQCTKQMDIPNNANLGPGHKQYTVGERRNMRQRLISCVGVGVGVAATMGTLKKLGGWMPFPGTHGEQEGGMTRRAWYTKTPVHLLTTLHVGHEFRKKWPYKPPTVSDAVRNQWYSYFTTMGEEAFEQHMRPVLEAQHDAKRGHRIEHGAAIIKTPEAIAERDRFAALKKRTDKEFLVAVGLLKDPVIHAIIPFKAGKQLGACYNEEMERLPDGDWALFIDHDVLILNPKWHEMCMGAIETIGHKAGIITCWTNNIGSQHQRLPTSPPSQDITKHTLKARALYEANGASYTDITRVKELIGGFFMLVSKSAWKRAGRFKDGFLGVDNDFHAKCMRVGLRVYRMDGLYCYHVRARNDAKWASCLTEPKQKVVYTANIGGKDKPKAAPKWPGWDFVYFTDNPKLKARGWEMRVVERGARAPRDVAREIKALPHKFLPEYDYSVWVDASLQPVSDVSDLCIALGWPDFATARHAGCDGVLGEAKRVVRLNKAPKTDVWKQMDSYRDEGFDVSGCPLYATGLVARRHLSASAIRVGELWAEQMAAHTGRDQLSLPFAEYKTNVSLKTFSPKDQERYFAPGQHAKPITMAPEPKPFGWYMGRIHSGSPFALSRYGDGEWNTILGHSGKNTDGNAYTRELGDALAATLTQQHGGNYIYGMQPLGYQLAKPHIDAWLLANGGPTKWVNADVLHAANAHGIMREFVGLLRRKPSILVAPAGHGGLDIEFDKHVVTVGCNCFAEIDSLVAQTVEAIQETGNPIVCFCMGMAAEVAIHRIWESTQSAWLIDVGSAFDPYVTRGVSRSYFKKMGEEVKKLNMARRYDATAYLRDRQKLLQLIPPNADCAEIGVLTGSYSRQIINAASPKRLHLVDSWPNFDKTDPTNKPKNGDEQHAGVLRRFRGDINTGRVMVHRVASVVAADQFGDGSLDWAYIDACHTYESACADNAAWWPKIKPGGWLAGHDYVNTCGVVQAVNEHCDRHGLNIDILTRERVASYAIRKPGD